MNPVLTVSVVIPAYNSGKFIAATVNSALQQTVFSTEVIVVDDASSDNTADVVMQIARTDDRVRLIRQELNCGPGAARNAGIEAAAGDWIALLDADDRFLPGRLAYLVDAAEVNQLDLAADNFYNYDSHANQIVGLAIPPDLIGDSLVFDRYNFVNHCMTGLAGAVDFGLLKPILRRSFLQRTGIRYREDVRHSEDFLLYLTALVSGGRFAVFPDGFYLYTQRFGALSHKSSDLTRTVVNYNAVEVETRRLADSDLTMDDGKLKALLLKRADKVRTLRKFVAFRGHVGQKQLLYAFRQVLLDRELRDCVIAAVRSKLKRKWRHLTAGIVSIVRQQTKWLERTESVRPHVNVVAETDIPPLARK